MGLVHGLKKIQPVVPDRKLALFKNLFYFLIPIDKDRAIAALGGDDLKGNILKHRGKMGTNSAALTEYDLGILIQQAEYELKGGNSEVLEFFFLPNQTSTSKYFLILTFPNFRVHWHTWKKR